MGTRIEEAEDVEPPIPSLQTSQERETPIACGDGPMAERNASVHSPTYAPIG